jgi:hypothetical protein
MSRTPPPELPRLAEAVFTIEPTYKRGWGEPRFERRKHFVIGASEERIITIDGTEEKVWLKDDTERMNITAGSKISILHLDQVFVTEAGANEALAKAEEEEARAK